MQENQAIGAAVVGGGAFGECHLRTLASMHGVELVGLYTLEQDRGKALCRLYGGKCFGSLDELACDPSIDMVSVVTPEDAHFESFKVLAGQGKAIYVEKPLASSLDEAREMLELSQSITAMSGHCLRFEARIAQVYAQREKLGRLRHMSFRNKRRHNEKAVYGRVHPAYAIFCHDIELANAFSGEAFRRVCALETQFSEGQVDAMNILIEYPSGATCSIEGGWLMPSQEALAENDRFSLDFEAGTFEMSLPNMSFTFLDSQGFRFFNQQYEHDVYGMEFGALRSALEYLAGCLRSGIQPEISTIEDGYQAVRLIEAALDSARSNCWVESD